MKAHLVFLDESGILMAPRLRRIGIVALARKILIALWRWVAFDEVAVGVCLRPA